MHVLSQAQVDAQRTPAAASSSMLRPSGSAQHVLASPSPRLEVQRPHCMFSCTYILHSFCAFPSSRAAVAASRTLISPPGCLCSAFQQYWAPRSPLSDAILAGAFLFLEPNLLLRPGSLFYAYCTLQALPPPPRPLPGGPFKVHTHGLFTAAWQSLFPLNHLACPTTVSVSYCHWELCHLCVLMLCVVPPPLT